MCVNFTTNYKIPKINFHQWMETKHKSHQPTIQSTSLSLMINILVKIVKYTNYNNQKKIYLKSHIQSV